MTTQLGIALIVVGMAVAYLALEIRRGLRGDGGCSSGRCGSCAPTEPTHEPGRLSLPQIKPPN